MGVSLPSLKLGSLVDANVCDLGVTKLPGLDTGVDHH